MRFFNLLIALSCIWLPGHPAYAQNKAVQAASAPAAPPAPAPATCTMPSELDSAQLLGQWTVIWSDAMPGEPASARLVFSRNPEFTESLIGLLDMGIVRNELAGDVEQDLLTLEESSDGKSISANWSLRAERCAKELIGQRVRASDGAVRRVTLRRSTPW